MVIIQREDDELPRLTVTSEGRNKYFKVSEPTSGTRQIRDFEAISGCRVIARGANQIALRRHRFSNWPDEPTIIGAVMAASGLKWAEVLHVNKNDPVRCFTWKEGRLIELHFR